MVIFRSIALVVTLVLAAGSCSGPTEPTTSLAPTIVAATRDDAGTISFDVEWRNTGTVPLFVTACGDRASMWLEKRGPIRWETFGGGICLAIYTQAPIRVEPDESIRARVSVRPGPPGEYRGVIYASEGNREEGKTVHTAEARVE